MSTIKIYGMGMGSALRAHWVAAELGTECETVAMDFSKGEHRSDWFLKINAMGQIPALSEGDFNLAESMAIGSYLIEKASSNLGGKDAQQRALAWQWSIWSGLNLQPHLSTLAAPTWTKQPLAPSAEAAAKEGAAKAFVVLDALLAKQAFVAGSDFTSGDINVACTVNYAMISKFDLTPYANVTKWLAGITDRPAYLKATASLRK